MSESNSENKPMLSSLISRATLVYVGLTEEKAAELWNQWINWPKYGPSRYWLDSDDGLQVTFHDICSQSLNGQQHTCCGEDDSKWVDCMNAWGISKEMQEAIMDPAFECIRDTNSCIYWVENTIDMRYRGLEYRVEIAAKAASDLEGGLPGQETEKGSQKEVIPSVFLSPAPTPSP